MSDNGRLPKRWTATTLGDIGDWCGGGTPSKENRAFWTDGTVPWVSPKDMKSLRILDSEDHISQLATQETSVKPFAPGTILVVVRSGILARTLPVAVCDIPATMNQDLKGIKPFDGIDSLYVAYFMIGNERSILHKCSKSGTTVASIEIPRLKAFSIRLPPTNEQRRIVAKIEELFSDLDAGVAALKRVKANLKRYRAAVLKAAVEGKLTKVWRAKHPNTEPATKLLQRMLAERRKKWDEVQLARFVDSDKTPPTGWQEKYVEPAGLETSGLPELPKGWCWARIEQVGHVQLGRQRSPKHHNGPHMRPYLRVANVFEDRIDISDVMEMNFTPEEYETYRLGFGDILLNEGQSMELIGRSAMYRDEVPGACFTNTLVRFRAKEGVDPHYALKVFLAYLKNGRFQKIATITVNIAHLGAGRFAEIEFPLPPIEEQAAIIEEVDQHFSMLEAAEQAINKSLVRAVRLRQCILKRAFEGKLVPQDPTDEPASVLLERLRASRSAAEGNGKAAATPARMRGRRAKANEQEVEGT